MNDDLISRRALLVRLAKVFVPADSLGQGISIGIDHAIDVIGEAPAVDAATRWVSVEEDKPKDFVSVLGHMTDAGDFPSVRECYLIDGQHFFFPALNAVHPVDKWMDMPEV